MALKDKPILVVGSVPGQNAEEVFRLVAPEIGDMAVGITDGEPGYRAMWVVFNAPDVYEPHPDLEVLNKPNPDRDKTVFKDVPDWLPTSWEDMWHFKVRDGVEQIRFETIYYAKFALDSYAEFYKLRDEGVIKPGVRFQVCLPFPEDFTRWCTRTNHDFEIMTEAITEVLGREIHTIVEHIPNDDLSLQFDVCWEVFACAADDYLGREPMPWKAEGDPYERFAGYMAQLAPLIPESVPLGMHLCYGDLEHSHLIEPDDLGVSVKMANLAVKHAGRRFDYVQMAVPRNRDDDAYFEPLKDLDIGDTAIYIGLVHYSDGVEGAMKRLKAFRRRYSGNYGIATECGWGRRKPETVPDLIRLHRDIASRLPE